MDRCGFSEWKEYVDNIVNIQKRIIFCNEDDYSMCWQNNMTPEQAVNSLSLDFDSWKLNIDKEIFLQTGYHCNDLPDYDYWNAWNTKFIPQTKVINEVINKFRCSYNYILY